MKLMELIIVGLIGLCLGSFTHVVIYRFSPTKTTKQFLYDISIRRSYCPHCEKTLGFLSLIPLLSWLVQQRRCKYCLRAIPLHYALTELLIACYCIVIILFFGISIRSSILIMQGIIFIILAVIDIKYFLLPNCITYFILSSGIVAAYFNLGTITLMNAIIGVLFGYFLLWLPAKSYYLIKKQVGLGGGDIKLLSALGAWIDYSQLPILLIIASFIGIVLFIIYYSKKPDNNFPMIIPFGPCLLISAYCLLILR